MMEVKGDGRVRVRRRKREGGKKIEGKGKKVTGNDQFRARSHLDKFCRVAQPGPLALNKAPTASETYVLIK